TIRTLDGVDRTLEPDMLVIADRDRAQAVAGVMGGAASEVSASTKIVAFERGADIGTQVVALQRAFALMEQIGAGRPLGAILDRYPSPREPKPIHLRR